MTDDPTEKLLREGVQELYYVEQQLVDAAQTLAGQADDERASQAFSEHYEIAAYGNVTSLAGKLGNEEVADLLEETLREEEGALRGRRAVRPTAD